MGELENKKVVSGKKKEKADDWACLVIGMGMEKVVSGSATEFRLTFSMEQSHAF